MPDFLDPINAARDTSGPGRWSGLLVVVFVESGSAVPDPARRLAAVRGGHARRGHRRGGRGRRRQVNFQLWQLLVFIPIAAILGGQVGYWIGRNIGTAMFKPNARVLKQRYLDEAHAVLRAARPVRDRDRPVRADRADPGAPSPPGAARMSYAAFTLFNVRRRRRMGCRPDAAGVLARPVRDHPGAARTDRHRDRGGVGAADGLRVVQAPQGGQAGGGRNRADRVGDRAMPSSSARVQLPPARGSGWPNPTGPCAACR